MNNYDLGFKLNKQPKGKKEIIEDYEPEVYKQNRMVVCRRCGFRDFKNNLLTKDGLKCKVCDSVNEFV